jgi:hypothetical protein
MNQFDDDLLTALRTARPDPGYEPSASSPEATALLARILLSPQGLGRQELGHQELGHQELGRLGLGRRVTRRRLLLTGVPVLAGAAAAGVLVAAVASSGPDSVRPTTVSVRTAILAALVRDSGDIVYSTRLIKRPKGPAVTQRAWTYPAFPVAGEQVRFRLFQLNDGIPVEDTESIYIADAATGQLSQSTTQGPATAEIIDVEYGTRSWSRQQSSSVLLAGGLSPSVIRNQIASGGFTVTGTVSLQGRKAIELTWSRSMGQLTITTTLWVDARSYVPLRSATTMRTSVNGGILQTDTTDYQILAATPANLDLLTPPIPAGFTRAARSPHF